MAKRLHIQLVVDTLMDIITVVISDFLQLEKLCFSTKMIQQSINLVLVVSELSIGLRDLPKRDGQSFGYYIQNLFWELRYAWQRAWIGYDSKDVFNLDSMFIERMPIILEDFRRYNVGLFVDRKSKAELSEEETNAVIDEMIMHFKEADGNKWLDTDLDPSNKEDFEKIKGIEIDAQCHEDEALRLFCKWFDNLWY